MELFLTSQIGAAAHVGGKTCIWKNRQPLGVSLSFSTPAFYGEI